ncbi:hypothetical protein ACFSO7_21770 [Bacillus sp. CGMCC 1.16607]
MVKKKPIKNKDPITIELHLKEQEQKEQIKWQKSVIREEYSVLLKK